MRHIPDKQITKHFRLYEFLEAQLPAEAVALNWKNVTIDTVLKAEELALELEKIRSLANSEFKSDLGFPEIGIRITSGYRCVEWEYIRKRSGDSQHTVMAVDVQPINCSRKQAKEILQFVYDQYSPWWEGGIAISKPKNKIGFIHIDKRIYKARWKY